METVLEKNIRNLLRANDISLAELSRLSEVPYRTLQDILALKQAPKITTLAAIAAGLGVTPSQLLEEPEAVPSEIKITPKKALEVLRDHIEKADSQAATIESLTQVIQDQEKRLSEFAKYAEDPLYMRIHKCSEDEKVELSKVLNMIEYARKLTKASSKVSKKIE